MAFGENDPTIYNTNKGFGSEDQVLYEPSYSKPPKQGSPLTAPTKTPPTLIEAGLRGLASDTLTGVARGLYGVNMPEWGKSVEDEANRQQAIQQQRPITDLDENFLKGAYEGVVTSLPSMAPTLGGAMAGAKLGAPLGPWGVGIGALVGGAAAALPQFIGSNLERQTKEQNIPLAQTDLGTASGTAVVQAAFDSLLGGGLFGGAFKMPAQIAAKTVSRVAGKMLAGGVTEGLTEAAQQWLEVVQANPDKAFEMPPEIVKEIRQAAILGGVMGGGFGAVAGIPKPRPPGSSPPAEEQPPAVPPAPPPQEGHWADNFNTIRNTPDSFPGLEDNDMAPGLYGHLLADDWREVPDLFTGFDEEPTNGNPFGAWQFGEANFIPQGKGLPQPEQPFVPDESVMGLPSANTGIRVFDELKAKFIAMGYNPIQAAAAAKVYRDRYETLGKQIGTDAYTAYKNSNISFERPGQQPNAPGGTVLNQDERPPLAMFYSQLQEALKNPSLKVGTGQQWLNYLQRNQVKPEELQWTGLYDFLTENKDRKLTPQALVQNNRFRPFGVAVYEADPHGQNKTGHYGEWTLDEYGTNKNSGYREIVLSAENMPPDTFQSSHYRMVPNAIAHFRKTDRSTPDGKRVYFMEEAQSDWHQMGRKRGYRGTDNDLLQARIELDRAIDARDAMMARRSDFTTEQQNALYDRVEEAFRKLNSLQNGVPQAPFKETWPTLILKQAIMDAINNGHEYFAWPTGDQMMQIQGHSSDARRAAHKEFYDNRLARAAEKLVKWYGGKVEKVSLGGAFAEDQAELDAIEEKLARLNADPDISFDPELQQQYQALSEERNLLKSRPSHSVHAIRITPAMRELVGKGGYSLFQRTVGQKTPTPKGNINILPDRMIIRLFKNADITTLMHEGSHAWVAEMIRYAPINRQIAADLEKLRRWVGNKGEPFTVAQHEQIARGLEEYLREGKAPTAGLKKVFEDFKKWFTEVYGRAKILLGAELTPEVRGVFDNWFNQTDQELRAPKGKVIGTIPTEPMRGTVENARIEGEPADQPTGLYTQTLNQDDTREANLLRWFGNSVVRNEDGSPKVVYHGTSKDTDFGRFKVGRHGAWFTTDPESASQYAIENDSMSFRYDNGRVNRINTASRVFPVYLKIEKPYSPTEADRKALTTRAGDSPTGYKRAQSEFFDRLRAQGYDGVDMGSGVWVVLRDPTQIKSTLNKGAFSPNSPLILNQDEMPSPRGDEPEQVSRWVRTKNATKSFFDPFSNIPDAGGYRDIRNLARGGVWAAQKAADDARSLFAGLNQHEKNRANEYFETRNADPEMLPPAIRTKAVELKRFINTDLKQQLQAKGLLPAEGMEQYDDSYLPRLYLKHLVESLGYRGGFRENKAYARKRKDKAGEQLIEMGEIKDPGIRTYFALFRTMRDIAMRDFLTKVSENPEWTLPNSVIDWEGRKVTPFWLKNEADHILQKRISAESDPARKQAMRERAQQMHEAAAEAIEAMGNTDYDASEYKKLPDSHDYGPLRGAVVRKQIAEDIQGTNNFVNADNLIDQWIGDRNSVLTRASSYWKVLKVPLNPPSIVRNIISNMILLHMSGVRIDRVVPRLIQAFNDMRHEGPYTQIARKWGVSGSTFSEQELYAISDDLNRLDMVEASGFAGWRKVARTVLKGVNKATNFYGKLEEWGKIAKIIDEMQTNDAPENIAVQRANDALFDYSEAHPSIKRLRQIPIGVPFACVDPQTEILTQRGWLKNTDVQVGDMAASFSMGDERLIWSPILELFRAPYSGDMIHVRDRHLDMFLTPNHRCVTYRINGTSKSLEIVRADELNTTDHIPVAASPEYDPGLELDQSGMVSQQISTPAVVQYDGEIWCPRTGAGTWLARRNGKVFVTGNTFQYKVIPLIADTIRKRPTVLLPYVIMGATIPALVASLNDIGPEDEEKLRLSLSKALRRSNSMYLLPWKDEAGRWQFADLGYFMPWQMPYDLVRSAGEGAYEAAFGDGADALQKFGKAFQTTGLLQNPLFSVVSAMTTGIDPFTGRPIADKRDPPNKQVLDVVSYVWSLAAPSLLASYGAAGQLVNRETGTGMNRFGEPATTYGQIAARAVGFNVNPVIPEAQRARNIQQMQYEIQNVKARLTTTLKDRSLTPEQRRNVIEDFREEIMYRTKKMQEYVRESAPSERLRRASSPVEVQ